MLSASNDEISDLNAKLSVLQIENDNINRKLMKLKQFSKHKDYRIQILQPKVSDPLAHIKTK